MGIRYSAVLVEADQSELLKIAESIQENLSRFQNPINFSILVYTIANAPKSKVIELVAFESKEASHLANANEHLLSRLKVQKPSTKKKSIISRFIKVKEKNEDPRQHIEYLCTLAIFTIAHSCSKVLGTAAAITLSDSLGECGHVIFTKGRAIEGLVVGPDGSDARLSFENDFVAVSYSEMAPDYHKYFLPEKSGSIVDPEDFLESLEYLGRIQLMIKRELISNESLVLQEA